MIPVDIDNFIVIDSIASWPYDGSVIIEMEYVPKEIANLQKLNCLWIRVKDPSFSVLLNLKKIRSMNLEIIGRHVSVTKALSKNSAYIHRLKKQIPDFHISIASGRREIGRRIDYNSI